MKLRALSNQEAALTLIEVLVVVIMVVVLVAMFLSSRIDPHVELMARRINCVNNLKEVYLAAKIWESDHGNNFPFAVSITKGGSMELAQNGDVVSSFLVMSNQLTIPKLLYCTADLNSTPASSFSDLSAKNISYFLGVNADEKYPRSIFSGDDSFEIGGASVKSGLLAVPANASIGWTAARHKFAGNIGFADGSVEQDTSAGLAMHFTNSLIRLAIP